MADRSSAAKGWKIQTILFPRTMALRACIERLREVGFKHEVDIKPGYWRFRQREPDSEARYRSVNTGARTSVKFQSGVIIVLFRPKNGSDRKHT